MFIERRHFGKCKDFWSKSDSKIFCPPPKCNYFWSKSDSRIPPPPPLLWALLWKKPVDALDTVHCCFPIRTNAKSHSSLTLCAKLRFGFNLNNTLRLLSRHRLSVQFLLIPNPTILFSKTSIITSLVAQTNRIMSSYTRDTSVIDMCTFDQPLDRNHIISVVFLKYGHIPVQNSFPAKMIRGDRGIMDCN